MTTPAASYVGTGYSVLFSPPSSGGTYNAVGLGVTATITLTDTSGNGSFVVGDSVSLSSTLGTSTGTFLGFMTISGTDYPVVLVGTNNEVIGASSGGSGVFYSDTLACFRRGTMIETGSGPVAVENLVEGDLVVTASGALRPVRWIGWREIAEPAEGEQPIRIQAHAFGASLPQNDLFLSPEHAVFAEGVLIPVRALVNGRSIARVAVDEVTYFHVELDSHDVILAEGLPCESFLDTAETDRFANARPAGSDLVVQAPVAPIMTQGEVVERVRHMLEQQSVVMS